MSAQNGVQLRRDLLKQNDMKNFSEQKLAENDNNISFSEVKATNFQVDDNEFKQIDNELDASKNVFFPIDVSQNCLDNPSNRSLAVKKQAIFKSNSIKVIELGGDKQESNSTAFHKQNNSIVSIKVGTSTSLKNKFIPSKENIQSQQTKINNLANTINEFKKKKLQVQSKSFIENSLGPDQQCLKVEQSQSNKQQQKPMQFFFFKKTNMIKRFITNLQSKARSFIFKRLSQHQFNLIGDKSSDYNSFQETNHIFKQVRIKLVNSNKINLEKN